MDEEKAKYLVPKEGSLGLLALGYVGVMAWRQKRKAENQKAKNQKNEG